MYPFYPEFLQSEVPYIEKHYDKVLVFSCNVHKEYVLNQKIGSKYTIFRRNELTKNELIKYLLYIISGVINCRKRDHYCEELHKCSNIKELFAVLYSIGKIEAEYSFISNQIKENTFSKEDEIFIYSFWFTDTATVAAMLKQQLMSISSNVYAFTRAHGADVYENRNMSGYIPFRKYCYENLDKIVPCSKAGEEYLKAKNSIYKEKISCHHLGTKDLGLGHYISSVNEITVVSCSNIIPLKRVTLIAEAICELEMGGITNIVWHCFGGGNQLGQVKEICGNLKKNKAIIHGPVKNEEILQFYKNTQVDVFINASTSEGLPVSIMEANSFGIPVIATDVGGTKEIVIDGFNGFLISGDELTKSILSKALLKFISLSLEDKKKMRRNARNTFLQEFDLDKNYDTFHSDVIKRLL